MQAIQLNTKLIGRSLLFVSGIFLFAWFIGSAGYLHWMAIAALLLPTVALALQVKQSGHAKRIVHEGRQTKRLLATTLIALVVGIFFGIRYRQNIGMDAWPLAMAPFAFAAMAIGAAEELIFRGALYYMISSKNAWYRILITAIAHAGYKTLLFLSPYALHSVDTSQLFMYTFVSGLLLGVMRHHASSVFPPLLAHTAWDVVVYGDSTSAPWWVW